MGLPDDRLRRRRGRARPRDPRRGCEATRARQEEEEVAGGEREPHLETLPIGDRVVPALCRSDARLVMTYPSMTPENPPFSNTRTPKEFHSEATALFGSILFKILGADKIVSERIQEGTSETAMFIDCSAPRWWVQRKETKLDELALQTERALASAQRIVEQLREEPLHHPRYTFSTYSVILHTVAMFAEQTRADSQQIVNYLEWLEQRDPLAPLVLFSYDVWGTTVRNRKRVEGHELTVERASEIALGLSYKGSSDWAWHVLLEVWEDCNEYVETVSDLVKLQGAALGLRIAYKVHEELSYFVTYLRQSLRMIMTEIDSRKRLEDRMVSDDVWGRFLRRVIDERRVETALWDVKRQLPFWGVADKSRKRTKVDAFLSKVASFANNRGGLIFVGIGDNREIVGVDDIENKISHIHQMTRHRFLETRDEALIECREIRLQDLDGDERPCLLILIRQSRRPIAERSSKTVPYREGPGTIERSREDVEAQKRQVKQSNFDFITDLGLGFVVGESSGTSDG